MTIEKEIVNLTMQYLKKAKQGDLDKSNGRGADIHFSGVSSTVLPVLNKLDRELIPGISEDLGNRKSTHWRRSTVYSERSHI